MERNARPAAEVYAERWSTRDDPVARSYAAWAARSSLLAVGEDGRHDGMPAPGSLPGGRPWGDRHGPPASPHAAVASLLVYQQVTNARDITRCDLDNRSAKNVPSLAADTDARRLRPAADGSVNVANDRSR
jgi:hypothetical protein